MGEEAYVVEREMMRGGNLVTRRTKREGRWEECTYGGGKGSDCKRDAWREARVEVNWERRRLVCSRVRKSASERGVLRAVAIGAMVLSV